MCIFKRLWGAPHITRGEVWMAPHCSRSDCRGKQGPVGGGRVGVGGGRLVVVVVNPMTHTETIEVTVKWSGGNVLIFVTHPPP